MGAQAFSIEFLYNPITFQSLVSAMGDASSSMLDPSSAKADAILVQAAEGRGILQGGEFISSSVHARHTPALIAKAAYQGFLPMSHHRTLLLKLHRSRCMLAPEAAHVGRQSRKKASQFRLSINEAFSEVVKGVQGHTYTNSPGDCWLHDELARMYLAVNQLPDAVRRGVAFHSVELWHKESGRLVAGEIGYTVGAIYSSCTGFALKEEFPGAGTLQLVALARLLQKNGFVLWDLGMGMDYKKELGGKMQSRASWIGAVRALREVPVALHSPEDTLTIKDLLATSAEQLVPDDVDAAAKAHQLLASAVPPAAAGRCEQPARPSKVMDEAISQLIAMGFPKAQAREALQVADGNADRAVALLLGDT